MPIIEQELPTGAVVEFETEPNISNTWVATEILKGVTYPYLPFIGSVETVVDAGANVGATSVFFSHLYPDATVHAIEPAAAPREILERNVAGRNVTVHGVALGSEDAEGVPLYGGLNGASILGSIYPREVNSEVTETITIRNAAAWASEHGIESIDVLKVDVEGAEVEVLESLAHLLPTAKVVYIEYGSRELRRATFRLLEKDHEIFSAGLFLDQGECVFLRQDLLDHPDLMPTMRALYRAGLGSG